MKYEVEIHGRQAGSSLNNAMGEFRLASPRANTISKSSLQNQACIPF